MAQDVESEDVGQVEDEPRDRRRGPLPIIALVAIVLIILWLLWQFLGGMSENKQATVVKTSTVEIDVPISPEPEVSEQVIATETVVEESLVPDVVGETQSSAAIMLESAGYAESSQYVNSDTAPSGTVIKQSPSAGAQFLPGGVVGLIVSRGSGAVAMVTMPDVIGLTQSAAESKVRAAGLRPYILHGAENKYAGLVGSQWPKPGTRVPEGSEGFIQVMIR